MITLYHNGDGGFYKSCLCLLLRTFAFYKQVLCRIYIRTTMGPKARSSYGTQTVAGSHTFRSHPSADQIGNVLIKHILEEKEELVRRGHRACSYCHAGGGSAV